MLNFVSTPQLTALEALTDSPDFQLEIKLLVALCEIHITPRSLGILICIRYEDWRGLLDLELDLNRYLDPSPLLLPIYSVEEVKNDYLVTKFIQKSLSFVGHLVTVDELKEKAVQSFFEAEEICFRSMLRLKNLPDDSLLIDSIVKVRKEVDSILGDLTTDDFQYIEDHMGPGSGSTTSVSECFTADEKYCEKPHVTRRLYPFAESICGPLWGPEIKPVLRDYNRFSSVRKNVKTDRGICIEPDLNVFVQRAIGKLIKGRLTRSGNSIKFQTRNQEMAARAYKDKLATIDLSMASDTICFYLVYLLLGSDWFDLLNLCRTPKTKIRGVIVDLFKFSSMGNGYTFELETVLFLAIARSIVPPARWSDVSVYGDDIIVPQQYAIDVVQLLESLGLLVNKSKSFLAGNFFESCGHDYFCGHDIRPLFARGSDSIFPYSLRLANSVRLYSKIGEIGYCDAKYRAAWELCKKSVPRRWLGLRIPESLGDCGLIDDYNACRNNRIEVIDRETGLSAQLEGYVVHVVMLQTVQRNRNDRFSLHLYNLARCGQPDLEPNYGNIIVRNQFGDLRKKRVFVKKASCNLKWLT